MYVRVLKMYFVTNFSILTVGDIFLIETYMQSSILN